MITLEIAGRQRSWKMDLAAFERVCDAFEQLGLTEYAENPLESLRAFTGEGQNGSARFNRKTARVFRAWLWAGLAHEEAGLTLEALAKELTLGALPGFFVKIMPELTDALAGPRAAETENNDAASGRSAASASA